jgi:hypothetical protein
MRHKDNHLKLSEHYCIIHNRNFPDNPMRCNGKLCSDCPFAEIFIKKRFKIRDGIV